MPLTFHFLNAKLFFFLWVTLPFAFASSNTTRGLTLRAELDDSPGSPLYLIENLVLSERVEKLINVTKDRVKYLDLVTRPDASLVPDNIRISVFRDGVVYTVSFTIGSQRFPVKLLMDTGGGLIWTQCKPCLNCFPQSVPIYDPRDSHSYGYLPCGHPLCDGGAESIYTCTPDRKCVYDSHYGGGALTRGVASFEAFQFYISRTQIRSFNNVIFGCSNDSHDIIFQNTAISGIFGLNLSPDSMLRQFLEFTHARFSYCLVPFPEAIPPRPLILWFGEDVPQPPHVQTTMFIVQTVRTNYYYLELLDISVADHRIGFPPYTFNIRSEAAGGCFIDSGALMTMFDTGTPGVNAYQAVKQVFEAYYWSRGLEKYQGGSQGLETCYHYSPRKYRDFASITFHFNGADYVVDGQLGHVFITDLGIFCVAILPGQLTILGAWHQQNKRLIYDIGLGGLQFADEQCINSVL